MSNQVTRARGHSRKITKATPTQAMITTTVHKPVTGAELSSSRLAPEVLLHLARQILLNYSIPLQRIRLRQGILLCCSQRLGKHGHPQGFLAYSLVDLPIGPSAFTLHTPVPLTNEQSGHASTRPFKKGNKSYAGHDHNVCASQWPGLN